MRNYGSNRIRSDSRTLKLDDQLIAVRLDFVVASARHVDHDTRGAGTLTKAHGLDAIAVDCDVAQAGGQRCIGQIEHEPRWIRQRSHLRHNGSA